MSKIFFIFLLSFQYISCSSPLMQQSDSSKAIALHGNTIQNQWKSKFKTETGDSFYSISFQGNIGVVTSQSERLWVTKDGGDTWEEIKKINTVENHRKAEGEFDLRNSVVTQSGYIYLIGHIEDSGSALFASRDLGKTWNVHYFFGGSLNDVTVVHDDVWVIGDISTEPDNKNRRTILRTQGFDNFKTVWASDSQMMVDIYFVDYLQGWGIGGKGKIFQSTNGGEKWTEIPSPVTELLYSITFQNETGLIAGKNGTILSTRDWGNTWISEEKITSDDIYQIMFVEPDEILALTSNGLILNKKFSEKSKARALNNVSTKVRSFAVKDNFLWAGTTDGKIMRLLLSGDDKK